METYKAIINTQQHGWITHDAEWRQWDTKEYVHEYNSIHTKSKNKNKNKKNKP